MTNKDKAKEIVQDVIHDRGCSDVVTDRAIYNSAMTMAEWKDEQLKAEKQVLIDKAYEWMDAFLRTHYIMRYHDCCEPCKDWIIEGFKQAMKGE